MSPASQPRGVIVAWKHFLISPSFPDRFIHPRPLPPTLRRLSNPIVLLVTSAAGVERRSQRSSFPTPRDAVDIQVGALRGLVREGFDDGRCGEKTGDGDGVVAAC